MKCPVKKCPYDVKTNMSRCDIDEACMKHLFATIRRAHLLIRNNPLSRCPSRYPTAHDKVIIEVSAKEVLNWKRPAVEIGAMKESK